MSTNVAPPSPPPTLVTLKQWRSYQAEGPRGSSGNLLLVSSSGLVCSPQLLNLLLKWSVGSFFLTPDLEPNGLGGWVSSHTGDWAERGEAAQRRWLPPGVASHRWATPPPLLVGARWGTGHDAAWPRVCVCVLVCVGVTLSLTVGAHTLSIQDPAVTVTS